MVLASCRFLIDTKCDIILDDLCVSLFIILLKSILDIYKHFKSSHIRGQFQWQESMLLMRTVLVKLLVDGLEKPHAVIIICSCNYIQILRLSIGPCLSISCQHKSMFSIETMAMAGNLDAITSSLVT